MKKYFLLFSLLLTSLAFADNGETQGNSTQMIVLLVVAAGFFYFILWRPEQKRRKAAEAQRASLQKGDKVTAMGIKGEVSDIKQDTVVLKMIEGAKIEFLKAAITDVDKGGSKEPAIEEK